MALALDDFHVGDIYTSNSYGDMQVIANYGSRDVSVKFLNTGSILHNLQRGNVIRGGVKDIFAPTVEGIGFVGTTRDVARTPAYSCWHSMVIRCYSENYHSSRGTYRDCSVCEEWRNFCNFEKWFDIHNVKGYHLDKDLLVQGNRAYSPETCCFIPPSINNLIVDNSKVIDGCEAGVSKRRKKGSLEYNGLYNVACCGGYLGRTRCLEKANSIYKEFKKLLFEELADKYEELGLLTPLQAEKLRTRKI